MADDKSANVEDQSNRDLMDGFEDRMAANATAPEPKEPQKESPPEPPKKQEPEHVTITKEQLERLEAAANKTADFEKQFDKAFGTIGNMQKLLNQLQAATPKGEAIELPDDVVAELEKDFPELAAHVRSALQKAFKSGVRGTGKEPATDKEAIANAIREDRAARANEELEDAYPDWKEIVGAVPDGKFDPKNPYRAWLATQDADYQKRINNTTNPRVIERSIDRFKAYQAEQKAKEAEAPSQPVKKPSQQQTAKSEARKERFSAAAQPRGDGGQPPARNPEDDLRAGFQEG